MLVNRNVIKLGYTQISLCRVILMVNHCHLLHLLLLLAYLELVTRAFPILY